MNNSVSFVFCDRCQLAFTSSISLFSLPSSPARIILARFRAKVKEQPEKEKGKKREIYPFAIFLARVFLIKPV